MNESNIRRPVADDVIAVLAEIRYSSQPNDSEPDVPALRKKAVLAVAQTEFDSKRFSNLLSAENSIRDGCVRRLGYAEVTEFDRQVAHWLGGRSHDLSARLLAKATTEAQRQRLAELLGTMTLQLTSPQAQNPKIPITEEASPISNFFDSQRTEALKRRLEELQLHLIGRPQTPKVVRKIQRILKVSERPSAITRYIKQTRGTICQLCGELGFVKRNGKRYCEVHHLFHLSKNPPPACLAPEYLVVLCASCHRRMHYADVGEPFRERNGWRVRMDDAVHHFVVELSAPQVVGWHALAER